MMKKQTLIEHIRGRLISHEEPYEPGSWETFRKHREKQLARRKRQRLFRAAAAFLIAGSLFAFAQNYYSSSPPAAPPMADSVSPDAIERPEWLQSPESTGPAPAPEQPAAHPLPTEREKEPSTTGSEQRMADSYPDTDSGDQDGPDILPARPLTAGAGGMSTRGRDRIPVRTLPAAGHFAHILLTDPLLQQMLTAPEPLERPQAMDTVYRFVDGQDLSPGLPEDELDSPRMPVVPESGARPLRFSIAYAPLMHMHGSEADLAMGGGFFTDWQVSEQFALSSGFFIAQNRLRFNDPETAGRSDTFLTLSTGSSSVQEFRYMQADLVSMEIPINIRYFLSESVSLTAGISSQAYLQENFHYRFDYQQPVRATVMQETGDMTTETRMVTTSETVTEREEALRRFNWAAFYNLSLDYRFQLARRHDLSMEPFVKIPTGRVTAREITYTTGGLQVRLFF